MLLNAFENVISIEGLVREPSLQIAHQLSMGSISGVEEG
jgi:hypothetical protein